MSSVSYIIFLAVALFSIKCYTLQYDSNHVVDKKFENGKWNLNPLQIVDPLERNIEYVESTPEEDVVTLRNSIKTETSEKSELNDEGTGKIVGIAAGITKQRKARQVQTGYKPIYPQMSSAPAYNSYQPYSNYNPSGPNSAHTPQTTPPWSQQWHPNGVNHSQSGYQTQPYNNHNYTHQFNANQGIYTTGQNHHNLYLNYSSHNTSGRPGTLPSGQYPYSNNTSFSHHSGSSNRSPNTTFYNVSQKPPYHQQWQSSGNSTYPGMPNNRPLYNSSNGHNPQYPSYSQYPAQARNSTHHYGGNGQYTTPIAQYPTPYVQYPTPKTQYPTPYVQYPTPNKQYPTSNGQYPTPYVQHPTPHGQYPTQNGQYPTPNSQYPTQNGQYRQNGMPNGQGQYSKSNGQYAGNLQPTYPFPNTSTGYRYGD